MYLCWRVWRICQGCPRLIRTNGRARKLFAHGEHIFPHSCAQNRAGEVLGSGVSKEKKGGQRGTYLHAISPLFSQVPAFSHILVARLVLWCLFLCVIHVFKLGGGENREKKCARHIPAMASAAASST